MAVVLDVHLFQFNYVASVSMGFLIKGWLDVETPLNPWKSWFLSCLSFLPYPLDSFTIHVASLVTSRDWYFNLVVLLINLTSIKLYVTTVLRQKKINFWESNRVRIILTLTFPYEFTASFKVNEKKTIIIEAKSREQNNLDNLGLDMFVLTRVVGTD